MKCEAKWRDTVCGRVAEWTVTSLDAERNVLMTLTSCNSSTCRQWCAAQCWTANQVQLVTTRAGVADAQQQDHQKPL